jgi:hypothetical protein
VIDGIDVAAVGDRPVFVVGLRNRLNSVAPVGTDAIRWLDACVFFDSRTLQCRIHDTDRYPRACRTYPAYSLKLDAETESERVEAAGSGDRLLDDTLPADTPPLPFGPYVAGATVFAYPNPEDLDGVVGRLRAGTETATDRAQFVGAAVGSHPTSLTVTLTRPPTRERRLEDDAGAPRTPGWDRDDIHPLGRALARTREGFNRLRCHS